MSFMKEAQFGFLYEPSKESEVVMLFGALMQCYTDFLMEYLGLSGKFHIDEWTENPTDCVVDVNGRKLRLEFELYSSNFKGEHDPKKCDIIVCWKDDWRGYPPSIKVLDLSKVVSKLEGKGFPKLILNDHQKRGPKKWSFDEFMDELKKGLSAEDFQEFKTFLDELQKTQGVDIKAGRGKIPTITIGFGEKSNNDYPIGIYANGKAWISYKNVNMQPPKPILNEEKAEKIRALLGGKSRQWHEIKASSIKELLDKIKAVTKLILEEE